MWQLEHTKQYTVPPATGKSDGTTLAPETNAPHRFFTIFNQILKAQLYNL